MATLVTSSSSSSRPGVRQSPYSSHGQADWDRQLDNLLEDLESSGTAASRAPAAGVAGHGGQASGSMSNRLAQLSSAVQQEHTTAANNNKSNGYSVVKSESGASLHESADTMLKDLEGSLKASSNFIESHRTVTGPTGTQEYHEYRSYSSGGDNNMPAPRNMASGDFNLERQVEHMMPPGSLASNSGSSLHGLQSANMVSSVQQSKQSYTTYKVQTNQYSSSGSRMVGHENGTSNSGGPGPDPERPSSRLKQNIDELDTLLDDLNNARKMSDAGADYTASSITPGNMSSDDYSLSEGHQGHVKRTVTSYNEYNYSSSGTQGAGSSSHQPLTDYGSRKPPSPSPRRRQANPSPSAQPLSSPHTVRKLSPGRSQMMSSSSYNYSATSSTNNTTGYQPQVSQPSGPAYRSPSPQPSHQPDLQKSPAPPASDGLPTGVSYYTKYHSTHSHQSQSPGPASFPTNSTPRLGGRTQAPPKRVDDLMTELSEFDSSIQHSGFIEPAEPPISRPAYREHTPVEDFGVPQREPSPVRPAKQPSTPGPAVYYPPGEMFSTTKAHHDSFQSGSGGPGQVVVTHTTSLEESGGRGKAKSKYKAKEKGRYSESHSEGGKQGAAVIPICLPFGCAAPCVIM